MSTAPVDVWQRRLDEGSVSLAGDVDAETLAEAFGGDRDRVDAITNRAFLAAMEDGATAIRFEHFEQGAEQGATDADAEDAPDESSSPEVVAEVEGVGSDETETDTETGTDADEPATTDGGVSNATDESLPSSADADAPPTGDGRQSRDDLEQRVADLEDSVRELEALHEALVRQLKQQTQFLVGTDHLSDAVDPADVETLHDRLNRIEAAVTRLDEAEVDDDG